MKYQDLFFQVIHNARFAQLILVSTILWCESSISAADLPIIVRNSGSPAVDALVVQLVSTRPAPRPSGYSKIPTDAIAYPYMTPQVSNAIARLKAMGPAIFPALVEHLRDRRYSFSDISAAWVNCSISDAVVEVLSDGFTMHSGYKSRNTPSGSEGYLSFTDYLEVKDPEEWAQWAKDKTRLAIQLDFIDWCVSKERQRGFIDNAQEKQILDVYERARETVKEKYRESATSRLNEK
jgi:hypothetical protein